MFVNLPFNKLGGLLEGTIFFQEGTRVKGGHWNDLTFVVWGVLLVVLMIFVLGVFYKDSLEKTDSYRKLPKLIFITFLMIRWVKSNTIKLLGNKNQFIIPFFIYIMFYFWAAGIVNLLGFKGILNFMIVPLMLSGIVFLGTLFFGSKTKGWGFCTDYFIWVKRKGRKIFPIPDVLAMLGEIGKVTSLAFRLWGNYFAGTLFLFIFSHITEPISEVLGLGSAVATSAIGLPLNLYFDVVDTLLHSMIFLFLTTTYWSLAANSVHQERK